LLCNIPAFFFHKSLLLELLGRKNGREKNVKLISVEREEEIERGK
jgi:hypothetical protein